jgi:hypothetical protein
MYDVTVKTYIAAVHTPCIGYATYLLEVEAESETEAKWIALQTADPEANRGSCVTDINELEEV